jgi:DNA polymerase
MYTFSQKIGWVMPSKFQLHCERWSNGCGSELCAHARKVVLCRGNVPCDVLFIGEAPGESENVIGLPFVGPAGRLLDQVIRQSGLAGSGLHYAMTNLVACVPRDEDGGGKIAEPPDDAVRQCGLRLVEFVALCNPMLVVCVGKLAQGWLDPGYKHAIKLERAVPMIDITHPAAILRANVAQKGLMVQRCVVALRNAIEEFCTSSQ